MKKDIKTTNGAEEPKKTNTFHNFGSPDHYENNFPKGKKSILSIEEEPVEEHIEYKSDSEGMGNGLREDSDSESEPIEQYLFDYEDEKPDSALENSLKPEFSQPKNGEDLSERNTYAKECVQKPKMDI
ncbi:hypothetical protein O181_003223 [Austropuccinia psidii MF-1]|uniref:Uncharacterized protein n=1 Tax=Austropuccinia psidii MF-1 TaxID=1389203 RepID=A0A9Q3GDC8_9BASI|nr:hypothetical protein [Austropuccinia psidii MF-1]